ncbi:hypothetical protein F4X73_01765 [Candidatus Poribacteria bacterium]|nr:hypothetical protein [Candidatus Poribacteria bacterium]
MRQNIILFILCVSVIINVTGCSVTRFTETRLGQGLKKANKTKFKLDFQFDYNASDKSFNLALAHQPYSIYKPRITLIDLGAGLAAVGIWTMVFYDNWDHDNTFDFTDDTFDWYDSEWWEKAVLIGVPADILLYWTFAYPFDRKSIKMPKQLLTNHPYRIVLPDHGYKGVDYTTTTGEEQIRIKEFLSQLGNTSYLRGLDSLKFRSITDISGKQHRRNYTVSPFFFPNGNGPDPLPKLKIQTKWTKNPIRAGEKAILQITVKNTGDTLLRDLVVTTSSDNPNFNNWEHDFGNIQRSESRTQAISFSSDTGIFSDNVTVILYFKAHIGNVGQVFTEALDISR